MIEQVERGIIETTTLNNTYDVNVSMNISSNTYILIQNMNPVSDTNSATIFIGYPVNSNTFRLEREYVGESSLRVCWQAIKFKSNVNFQSGVKNINSNPGALFNDYRVVRTEAISTVDPTKSFVLFQWSNSPDAGTINYYINLSVSLAHLDPTEVGWEIRQKQDSSSKISWAIVDGSG